MPVSSLSAYFKNILGYSYSHSTFPLDGFIITGVFLFFVFGFFFLVEINLPINARNKYVFLLPLQKWVWFYNY